MLLTTEPLSNDEVATASRYGGYVAVSASSLQSSLQAVSPSLPVLALDLRSASAMRSDSRRQSCDDDLPLLVSFLDRFLLLPPPAELRLSVSDMLLLDGLQQQHCQHQQQLRHPSVIERPMTVWLRYHVVVAFDKVNRYLSPHTGEQHRIHSNTAIN